MSAVRPLEFGRSFVEELIMTCKAVDGKHRPREDGAGREVRAAGAREQEQAEEGESVARGGAASSAGVQRGQERDRMTGGIRLNMHWAAGVRPISLIY